jgi:type IV pilus assembly protein PilF
MIRRLLMPLLPLLPLLLTGCVTSSNSPFQGDNVSMKQASQDNVTLGIAYLKQGNRDAAMQKIQKAITQDPDNARAYTAEALIYNADDEPDKAKDAYKIALRKAPDDPEIQNNYAVFLCQQDKPKDSLEYFMKAAANPHYTTPDGAYVNAGLCASRIPDLALAEQYFRKALAINPNLVEPLFQLAQLSYNQKKYLSARAFIERYDTLVPASRPDVLLLAVNNERALGDRQAAADYAKQLLKLYPASEQAQQLDQQAAPHG